MTDQEAARFLVLLQQEKRAAKRRHLYATDPIWRLTKLKDGRERRLRAKRARETAA